VTPEEMQNMIQDLRPDLTPLLPIRERVQEAIAEMRSFQNDDDRQDAMDALTDELVQMSEDIDVYDRDQAIAFSQILKTVYDFDLTADLSNPEVLERVSERADFLQRLRERVSQGDRRFGIIRNSDRRYLGPLYPNYATALKALQDGGYDGDEHSVLEHMGEAWESFLALGRPMEEWQPYITAYNQRILSSLVPLQAVRAPAPSAPVVTAPVAPVQPAPARTSSGVRDLSSIPVPMLDPLTGLVSTVSPTQASPDSRVLPPDFNTNERDRFGRRVIVPATLSGLARWVESTYRTHGDAVSTIVSDAGGVVSVTITGDTDSWRQRTERMNIPVALSISEQPAEQSITFAYL